MQRGISLRYKLLLTLCFLTLVSVALYAFVAIDLFKKDKIAYVLDSCASISESLSKQVNSELKFHFDKTQQILQGYSWPNRQFGGFSKRVFKNDEAIHSLYVYEKTNNNWAQRGKLQKGQAKAFENGELERINQSIGESSVYVSRHDQLLTMALRPNNSPQSLILASFMLPELASSFSDSGNYLNHLINEKGDTLLAPQDVLGTFSNWDFFSKLTNIPNQTFATKSPEGEEIISSISSTQFPNIKVVTLIDKSSALAAVKRLLTKSLLFLICVVSFTVFFSLFASSQLTKALNSLLLATKQVAGGNYDIDINIKSKDEVGKLADSFKTMAGKISHLISENVEKARMEAELKTAKAVQETLFPEANSSVGPLEISGFYESASECGGDWWHYNLVNDKAYLWIGDATGHGAPAALITAAAKTVSTIVQDIPDIRPAKIMKMLNKAIYDASKGKMCMTFFICSVDQNTGELVCCNCSHEPPIVVPDKEGLNKQDLRFLDASNNFRLGQNPDTEFSEFTDKLGIKERLYLYTDGVTELNNESNDMYGERRLYKALVKHHQIPEVAGYVQQLKEDLYNYRNEAPLDDDVTFFVCERK